MCVKGEREHPRGRDEGSTSWGCEEGGVSWGRDEGGTSWVVRKVARPTQEGTKPRGKISE